MKNFLLIAVLLCAFAVTAQDINLPQPQKTGGMPLMEALNKRASHREFTSETLDNQTLSNLLWAAWGFNRADKRTAPTANNKQTIDLYVVMKSGTYLYDARNNKLIQLTKSDLRKETGSQDFVADAALNIVFVSDKNKGGSPATDCGFISQNIYLFCASEGLGTVVRGWFDRDKLPKVLNLSDNQEIILTQTVGKIK